MIPEVLVGDRLRLARRIAREATEEVGRKTGCHCVAVVAEFAEGSACTSMAVDAALEQDPETEVSLMQCALARIASLLVLHLGVQGATAAALRAVSQGARLARLAEREEDASAG